MPQRIIGLTGGIATGKSTVAAILAEQGIPVSDADQLARQAVAPGSPILERIQAHFGSEILQPDGQLDRAELGRRIFHDPTERTWLESQIHPYVKDQHHAFLHHHHDQALVCLMIPLLFEAHMTDWVTEIWVVSCPESLQIQRLQQRNGLPLSEIEARIRSQWPLSHKIERADVVIDNSGTLADLRTIVLQALDLIQSKQ